MTNRRKTASSSRIQTRPQEYSVLCTLNLNGDYIFPMPLPPVVGGLGMAPGANIG